MAAVATAVGRRPAGICNQGLQGCKADESKSRLEEGSEASIGSTDPATSRIDQIRGQIATQFTSGFKAKECPASQSQGQGFADTAPVKGWALQALAELNLAGTFMWHQIKHCQQRCSPAAHRTSASMGTRPVLMRWIVLAGAGFMQCLVPWK